MNNLKIMTMTERVFFRKAKFMCKISDELAPEYINGMFTNRQQVNLGCNESQILRSMTSMTSLISFYPNQTQNYTKVA